jgi:hypothetical protein
MCWIGQKGSSNWPTATRLKATSLLGLRFPGIPVGALVADDSSVRELEDAAEIAERSGDDYAASIAGGAGPCARAP